MTGAQISVSLTYINANRRRAAAPALAFDLAAAPGKEFLSAPPVRISAPVFALLLPLHQPWRSPLPPHPVKNSCPNPPFMSPALDVAAAAPTSSIGECRLLVKNSCC